MTDARAVPSVEARPPGARISRAALVVAAISAAVFAVHGALFYGYHVDDAFITFRYADNVVSGFGFVWNRGEAPVEGYTNFSWLLLSAFARVLGFAPDRAMLAVGYACGLGCVGLSVAAARRFAAVHAHAHAHPRPIPPTAGLVAGLVAATFTGLALYATTGLETALHALLFVAAALALVERRALAFGALVGLAFLTRPEAALLGIVGLAFFALAPADRADRTRPLLRAALAMAALVVPYLAFKELTFGSLFPNTLAAKEPSLARGFRYLLDDGWPAGALAVATYVGARVERRREARELGVLAAVFALAVALEGGDWMPASRMLVPIVLFLAVASDATVRAWATLAEPRLLSALGLVLLLPWFGANAVWTESLLATGPDMDRMNDARRTLVARLSREHATRIALVDIGLPGYLLPDVAITDLGGLVDRKIGHAPGGHLAKHPSTDYLASRRDALYILTTKAAEGDAPPTPADFQFEVERYVAATEWFRAHYRLRERIDGWARYRMYVYERVDRGRPPWPPDP